MKSRICLTLIALFFLANSRPLLGDEQAVPLRVITHNVWYGFNKKAEPRHENWLRWMADQAPDVVALQELNGYTAERLGREAKAWGHDFSVLLKTEGFPTGLTSRYPITDVKRILDAMHHGLLRCRIRGVWFYVVHFHPSNYARRVEEVAVLADDIRSLPDDDPQIVLAGDFNGFSPIDRASYEMGSELVDFFEMLDTRDGAMNLNNGRIDYGGIEAVLTLGFVDTVGHFRKQNEQPFVGTFPAKLVSDENHGTDRRIDYIFVSSNMVGRVESADVLRDPVTERLSDHIPVIATVRVNDPRVFLTRPELLQETGAGEGPAWHPQIGLLTSGEGHINLRDRDGTRSVYLRDAGSNGLMFDRQGRLVICQPVLRRVVRQAPDGTLVVLADRFNGMRFNQPNDLTVDSKNRLYFSDPCYGDRSAMEMVDADGETVEGVYRIDPDGAVVRVLSHEVDWPNGLVVTADDQYLFVADNNNLEGGARKLWRFELESDGSVASATKRLIYDWGASRGPDGMKLDVDGRLFVAAGINRANLPHETADPPTGGIYVFSTDCGLVDFLPIPSDETTNCGFGGEDLRTLYITSGGRLWGVRTARPGAPAWPSRAK
jgi:gluconolactonase